MAREELRFELWDAAEAPGRVRQVLDQFGLSGSLRTIFSPELLAVGLVGFSVLAEHDRGAAGQAVFESVLRGAKFTVFGARGGGLESVGAIGAGLGRCWRLEAEAEIH